MTDWVVCPNCKGTGFDPKVDNRFFENPACPFCNGDGQTKEDDDGDSGELGGEA